MVSPHSSMSLFGGGLGARDTTAAGRPGPKPWREDCPASASKAYPDAPTTPSDTIDRLTTPSSLLWHPRRCYGRSPFVIHFLQVYNPTMSVIQFFLAKLYGTRRGNNWHEGFQYKANGKTKLWSSESRGNKQI